MSNPYVRIFVGTMGALLIALTAYQFAVRTPGGKYFSSQVGLEFGLTSEEMRESLPKEGIPRAIADLKGDTWVFIPAYILLFLALASHLKTSIPADGTWYFYAVMACALIAAVADWTENRFILITLNATDAGPEFAYKYAACFLKWFMIGLSVFLISLGYFSLKKYWVALPGFVNAAILVAGVIFAPALIQWGFGMMGLLLILAALFS